MSRRPYRASVLGVLVILAAASPSAAQKTLRWKFHAGQTLRVKFSQRIEVETLTRDMPRKLTTDMRMETRWRVEEVDQQGAAQITAAFTRLSILMATPGAAPIQYDSASDVEPSDEVRDIAAAVAPLVDAEFSMTLSARGEILKVRLSEQAARAIAKAGARESKVLGLFTENNINRIFRQSLGLLPQRAVDVDQNWIRSTQSESPLGPLTQRSTYTYRGTRQREGRSLEEITVDTELELSKPIVVGREKLSLKEQQHSGVFYFDAEAGRVTQSELQQRLVSEAPYRGKIITTRSDSILRMTLATTMAPAP